MSEGVFIKIFVSWSGTTSNQIAEALKEWLPTVMPFVEPWVSSSDIEAGSHWSSILFEQLNQTQFGIICITPENFNEPWLLFEAGALSKTINNSARVCPYLFGLEPKDLFGPLAQFQAIKANTNGTKKLLQTINLALGKHSMSKKKLDETFSKSWPPLGKFIAHIANNSKDIKKSKRSLEDMVEEILEIVSDMK